MSKMGTPKIINSSEIFKEKLINPSHGPRGIKNKAYKLILRK